MKNRTLVPIKTEDGSYTLLFKEINEHYHSLDGALSESQYVYIDNGLDFLKIRNGSLAVFELGVGTGQNVLLTSKWALKNSINIEYIGIEPFPVDKEVLDRILQNSNFSESEKSLLLKIQSNAAKEELIKLSDLLKFKLFENSIENFDPNPFENYFDIIYFDAFAPSRQLEVWNVENLKKCYKMLKSDGILTTYCASGQFKRNLLSSGFQIDRLKGFSSKREMFRGVKT